MVKITFVFLLLVLNFNVSHAEEIVHSKDEGDLIERMEKARKNYSELNAALQLEELKLKSLEEKSKQREIIFDFLHSAFPALLLFCGAIFTALYSSHREKSRILMEKKLWVYEEIINESKSFFKFTTHYMTSIYYFIDGYEPDHKIVVKVDIDTIEGDKSEMLLSAIADGNSIKAKFIMANDDIGTELIKKYMKTFFAIRNLVAVKHGPISKKEFMSKYDEMFKIEEEIYKRLKI